MENLQRIKRAVNYIEMHLKEKTDIKMAAREAALSLNFTFTDSFTC